MQLEDGCFSAVEKHQSQQPLWHSWGTVILGDTHGSTYEISGAWVGFWYIRLRRRMMTLEEFTARGRDFSSCG